MATMPRAIYPPQQQRTSGYAIASFSLALPCALLLLVRFVQGIGLMGCVAAVVLGIVALVTIHRDPTKAMIGRTLAWFGIVISGSFVLLAVGIWVSIRLGY